MGIRKIKQFKEVLHNPTIIDQIHDAVIVSNLEGMIIGWNKGAEKQLGYTAKEIIGRPIYVLYPEEKHKYLPHHVLKIIQEKGNFEYEIVMRRKSGGDFFVHSSLSLLTDDKGTITGIISYSLDITERKKAEIELGKYQNQLEKLVKARTEELELAQKELLQKERLAVLGQLTATVSHELRNPLGTISSSLYMIGEKVKSKNTGIEKLLERAERNIVRCDTIIDELLSFTRDRKLNLEKTAFDDWCSGILDEYNFPDNIKVSKDLRSGVVLKFEKESMHRCLINVINNACQAMNSPEVDPPENGSLELKISSMINDNKLHINIVDSGPGILESEIDRIFEPLYSTKTYGIGLGLPIVKRILEQHTGGITVTSKERKGTSVDMWLPL